MDNSVFRKFSDNLKKVLVLAERIAREQGAVMNTEHQLMALVLTKGSLAHEILTSFDVTSERLQLVVALVNKNLHQSAPDGLTEDAKEAIKAAVSVASQYGHFAIDTEHLLLALVLNHGFNSYSVIERVGVKPDEIKKQLEVIFGGIKDTLDALESEPERPAEIQPSGSFDGPDADGFGPIGPLPGQNFAQMRPRSSESLLDAFTTNLTKEARESKLDPVVGRDRETERLIQILCRRTKNNPVLIGEPGIGKTAIVEGLAQRIIDGQVPAKLSGKEILAIDMGALLAGTMYRGQFESRVKKMLAEIKRSGNSILFVDEIHTVVGAGSTEGSIDAANLLKPMLARGELRMIGSTTLDEYKKHIEKDPAFERRFQPILVKEPSIEETLAILGGIKQQYESYHKVQFTAEAIEAAVRMSARYINDRNLPDKAIDLIDEAAASTNTIDNAAVRLSELRRELRQILRQKEELILSEDYERATRLREKELAIEAEIRRLKTNTKEKKAAIISAQDIAKVVSRWTGIPVSELTVEEKKRFLDLEGRIKKHLIGQDEAVSEVAKAIRRARVGVSNPHRPTGSFIFLGPTGVGKTELAKIIAHEVLGSRDALIKIDMSEFMERHNVSRLIGAPAGYIGYEEGGKLTEAVRRNPYSVILFDEIEKAHPEVFNILLQIMEDGELTDARGRRVDFKNTILAMTSNLGTNVFDKHSLIGFAHAEDDEAQSEYEQLKESVFDELEDFFRPEFLNRVDKVIVFRPLSHESVLEIVNLQIEELNKRLSEQKITLIVESKAKNRLAEIGFDPDFGARPIRKAIADHIENPLAEAILREEFQAGDTVKVLLANKKISLRKAGRLMRA
ncbi:MAG: ATP-dependent Clp protease ATP-binding subunit [Patescibacteria group bacterium]|mgnify:CR=1 FL=1